MANAKVVNEKLFNKKLFRSLKVETVVWGDNDKVSEIVIQFPERGQFSKLTEKQVEPLRKEIARSLKNWERILD